MNHTEGSLLVVRPIALSKRGQLLRVAFSPMLPYIHWIRLLGPGPDQPSLRALVSKYERVAIFHSIHRIIEQLLELSICWPVVLAKFQLVGHPRKYGPPIILEVLLQVIVWQILRREQTKWHYWVLLPLVFNLRPEKLFPKSLLKCHFSWKAKSRGTPHDELS